MEWNSFRFLLIRVFARNGYWIVDFCRPKDEAWYLTDMTLGADSYHWATCPKAPSRNVGVLRRSRGGRGHRHTPEPLGEALKRLKSALAKPLRGSAPLPPWGYIGICHGSPGSFHDRRAHAKYLMVY